MSNNDKRGSPALSIYVFPMLLCEMYGLFQNQKKQFRGKGSHGTAILVLVNNNTATAECRSNEQHAVTMTLTCDVYTMADLQKIMAHMVFKKL